MVTFEVDANGVISTEIILSDVKRTDFGFEIVAIWRSKSVSHSTFFTDVNGIEIIEREQHSGIDG